MLALLRCWILSNINLSEELVSELVSSIKLYASLEKLYMCNNSILSLSAIILSEALATISTLKVLDLQGNKLTPEAGNSLASVIINNRTLEVLFLDNNNLGVGALSIVKALQNIKSLRMLGLSNNNLPKEISREVSGVIKSNCNLEMLALSSNDLRSSAIVILQALSTITTLKILKMNDNQIGEKGGEVLATVILNNIRLIELHFNSNSIQNSGIKVSEALQNISCLKSLDLSNNKLPEAVGIKLSVAIESNHSLKELCLHNNNLQSSIDVILQALSKVSTLELLDLHGSHLTPFSANGLESAIKNNTGLKCLYINENNLGKGLIIILNALNNLSSLIKLNISDNNFMNDVIAYVRVANKLRVLSR